MSVNLSPAFGAGAQLFNDNGDPLAGGKILTYLAGSTTPATTYTTSVGNISHSNPIILDATGRVPAGGEIWLTNATSYKFLVKDSSDALIGTYDNLDGINSVNINIQNFTGNGVTTSFALSSAPATENNTSVYINGVYQNKNTYSLSTTNVVFSEAPPINSKIEVSYYL